MIAAIVVKLPMVKRPVAPPVLAKLVIEGTNSASRLWLACRMAQMLAGALPGRRIHVVANAGLDASPAAVIERYASRWSIEVAIEDARQVFGAGQAPSRTARAVEPTIPFQLACQAIATCWYATAGHDPADTEDHRARAPW